jgi:hypothetical protein
MTVEPAGGVDDEPAMSPQAGGEAPAAGSTARLSGRREARVSLWMLAVFVVWTLLFIAVSGWVATFVGLPTSGSEVLYLEEWVPWVAVTTVWLLPLLVGLGLGLDASRRDRHDALAKVAVLLHAVIMVGVAGPALLDRLVHLG